MRRLALLALLMAGSAASAAPPPIAENHQLRMRPENAQCLIRVRPDVVRTWLSTLQGTAAEKKLIRAMDASFHTCFSSWPNAYASTFDGEGIRRGLVREMLRPSLPDLPAKTPSGLSRGTWYPPEQATDSNASAAVLANDLGFCLARTDWPATRAVVVAGEDTEEARAALRRVVPLIAGCIPPGQKLTLDAKRLRTILLETVYHATN
jgi:hypothetical protein